MISKVSGKRIPLSKIQIIISVLLIQISVILCQAQEDNATVSIDQVAINKNIVQSPEDVEIRFNEISPMRNKCSVAEDDLDRCSAQLIAFGQSKAQYPNSMEELNSVYCPSFKNTVDCIKNSTDCFKPFERQIINWILSSTRRMNHKRCKNDNEKQKFLKLTHSCFAPMRDPMDRCMSKYIANLEAIADFGEFVERLREDDLQIQLSCCANMKFKQCVMSNAKQQCRPLESLKKLKRTNSNSSQRTAHRSLQKAMTDMMEDVKKTIDGMALTGPEFICQMVDENFCKTKFEGRFNGRAPRHRSIVPAMLRIYSNNQ